MDGDDIRVSCVCDGVQPCSCCFTDPTALLTRPRSSVGSAERLYETIQIVLVGKYITLQDSYMSVVKALEHASMRCGRKLELKVCLLFNVALPVANS